MKREGFDLKIEKFFDFPILDIFFVRFWKNQILYGKMEQSLR